MLMALPEMRLLEMRLVGCRRLCCHTAVFLQALLVVELEDKKSQSFYVRLSACKVYAADKFGGCQLFRCFLVCLT